MGLRVGSCLIACLICGCAIGHVSHDGDMRGFAFGHAKLSYCVSVQTGNETNRCGERCTAVPITPAQVCNSIEGGALSVSAWDFLGSLAAGALTYGIAK